MKTSQIVLAKSSMLKVLFFCLIICLSACYGIFAFNGLTSKVGMDQAQIGREIARGHGITTKFIRPLAVQQLQEAKKEVDFNQFYETTHAPLNSLIYAGVLKVFGADTPGAYPMADNDQIYLPDRIIAGTCIFFFLLAVFLNYHLIAKIFDGKIAAITAFAMIFYETFWLISQSGLPQMLMLAIFSAACYVTWDAIVKQEIGQSNVISLTLAGILFGALALANWITLWIFLGFLVFALFYFKNKLLTLLSLIVPVALFIVGPLIFYQAHSNGPLGNAYFYIIGGSGQYEDAIFKSFDTPMFDLRGLVLRVIRETLIQFTSFTSLAGGFVIVTAFFIALLHPFKRSSIAVFRWFILTMSVFAAMGMAIYGADKDNILDPTHLHILFMPLMTAYGMAIVTVIWSRMQLSKQFTVAEYLPYFVIILITATPMLTNLTSELSPRGLQQNTVAGYSPTALNRLITAKTSDAEEDYLVKENEIIASDQPWAVAWYADKRSLWLPRKVADFNEIRKLANKKSMEIMGIHISPISQIGDMMDNYSTINGEFQFLAYKRWLDMMIVSKNEFSKADTITVRPHNEEAFKLIKAPSGDYHNLLYLVNSDNPNFFTDHLYSIRPTE